jgi:phospholipase C
MPFTYRMHKAFVNLDSGGSMQFRLPPMTKGPLLIRVRRITVGETDQPGDHSPSGALPGPAARVDWDRLGDLDEMRRNRWITPGLNASTMLHGTVLEDDSGIPDPPGGGIAPAPEITLELMQRDQSIQQRAGGQNLLHHMPTWPGGAGLWLKVSRQADGSSDRRRYMIDAQYPSVLPLVDYRAPLAFWKRGFDENWNKANYFEMLQVEAKVVQYRLDRKLSLLYDLEREKTISLPLPSVVTRLPTIDARNIKLDAGWAQDPIIPPSTTSTKVPYISLRIDFVYVGSRDVVLNNLPDFTLPEELWVELRLQLRVTNGRLIYVPVLLLPPSIPDVVEVLNHEIELGKKIKDGVERSLYMAQWGEGGLDHFDEVIRPWLVGHYELAEIEYDEATAEMVLWHVGKPIAVPIQTIGGGPIGGSPPGLPDLFATVEDEKWAEPPLAPPIIRRPPVVDPGELLKIEHIVVLMQENRSFDQVFGYLSREGLGDLGIQDVEGLAREGDRDVNEYQFSPIADPVRFRSTLTNDTSWPFEIDNPCHSRDCVSSQMSGGMKSFVANFAQRLARDGRVPPAHHELLRSRGTAGLRGAGSGIRHLRPLVRIAYRRHAAEPARHAERRPQPRPAQPPRGGELPLQGLRPVGAADLLRPPDQERGLVETVRAWLQLPAAVPQLHVRQCQHRRFRGSRAGVRGNGEQRNPAECLSDRAQLHRASRWERRSMRPPTCTTASGWSRASCGR